MAYIFVSNGLSPHTLAYFIHKTMINLPEDENESVPNSTSLPSLIASWTSSSRAVPMSSPDASSDTSATASKFALAIASVLASLLRRPLSAGSKDVTLVETEFTESDCIMIAVISLSIVAAVL